MSTQSPHKARHRRKGLTGSETSALFTKQLNRNPFNSLGSLNRSSTRKPTSTSCTGADVSFSDHAKSDVEGSHSFSTAQFQREKTDFLLGTIADSIDSGEDQEDSDEDKHWPTSKNKRLKDDGCDTDEKCLQSNILFASRPPRIVPRGSGTVRHNSLYSKPVSNDRKKSKTETNFQGVSALPGVIKPKRSKLGDHNQDHDDPLFNRGENLLSRTIDYVTDTSKKPHAKELPNSIWKVKEGQPSNEFISKSDLPPMVQTKYGDISNLLKPSLPTLKASTSDQPFEEPESLSSKASHGKTQKEVKSQQPVLNFDMTLSTLPSQPKPTKALRKKDYTDKEWVSIQKSRDAASKGNKLFGIYKAEAKEDNAFLSKLEGTSVISADLLKSIKANTSRPDLDLDNDIEADLDEGFHVSFDESRNYERAKKATVSKYEGKSYPGSLKKAELTERVAKQYPAIAKLLSDKKALLSSRYFQKALEICKKSNHSTLSQSEFLKLPMAQSFSIGFYGLKRQTLISHQIKTHFARELDKLALTNKVVIFWSVDSFVTYILTCEIAVRLASQDLKCTIDEAYEVLQSTQDYGKYITDEDSVYD